MAKKNTKPSKTKQKTPPVVVVLGHVDHGKTTLLDAIRQADVASGEAGGITQHIGAYQVSLKAKNKSAKNSKEILHNAQDDQAGSLITFIDTPGHEAFSKMRSRGAQVADLAILVVAANDGVKPQTKEAIAHIKLAEIPFIVAINKTDLPDVNLDVTKAQLAESEVLVEGYGGDIVVVPISAKNKKGLDQLLEMIGLVYELQEVKKPKSNLEAVILESYVDSRKGVIANILIRSGKIKIGQEVYCQNYQTKVRCLLNDKGQRVEQAITSQPVQILGFKQVLPTGELITDQKLEIVLEKVEPKKETEPEVESEQKPENNEEKSTEDETEEVKEEIEEETKTLKIIIKADVAGTLEAIKANLTEEIELVGEGVGDINESDVLLAQSTQARLIGFHVGVPRNVKKLAEMEKIKIEIFDVIYHLLEDLQDRVLKLIEPTINEEILGKAEIIAEFKIKGSHIAGCKVKEGKIVRGEKLRILREKEVVAEPRIGALQVERKDEIEAKKGQEVALVFRPDFSFKVGDQVISYKIIDD